MPRQKSRTNAGQNQWSLKGAKDLQEQERVLKMLTPNEESKKRGRPLKKDKGKKDE